MVFWVWLDDSTATSELAVGAAVAAMGAVLVELVQHQSATHFRMSIDWVAPALGLPIRIGRDLVTVARALWRYLAHAEAPPSAFVAVPTTWGGEDALGTTRRTLVLGSASVSPNSIALGLDADREVMVVHRLVVPDEDRRSGK